MNQKTTKRALLASVMSLMLSLAMLIGATFAWFTDTASTAVNKIQSGALKLSLQYAKEYNTDGTVKTWDDAEGGTLSFLRTDGTKLSADANILWEPGATYKLPQLKISNEGSLALKYKVVISGATGDTDLLSQIDFTSKVNGGAAATFTDGATLVDGKQLLPKEGSTVHSDTIDIEGTMKTTAGNTYQNKTVTGIAITVVATQATYENDSISDQYDKDAAYPVANAIALQSALKQGGIVAVDKDINTNNIGDTLEDRFVIDQPTTLNLQKKIKSPDDMGNNNTNFVALLVRADTTINAKGIEGGIDTGTNGGYGMNVVKGATLTINGGYYYGGGTAVQCQKGTVVINDGLFAVEPYSNPSYGYNFLLNCVDSAYKDGTAKIIVKGGTFVNFDPSNNAAEGANTNFVADGYHVVSKVSGETTYYTVVAD